MIKQVVMALLILLPAFASGAGLNTTDFAYGIGIEVPPGTAVAALTLPKVVYKSVFRDDLGDIRVFNAQGEPVPHRLQVARTTESRQPWRSLPFFPLPEKIPEDSGGYRVFVKTGPNGAVVAIDPSIALPADAPVRSFLVDASRFDRRMGQLRLTWRDDGEHRMTLFRVDTSDDLVSWSTVKTRWAVASIAHAGHRLFNNTLTISSGIHRYLRLDQIDVGPPLSPDRIEGRAPDEPGRSVHAFVTLNGTVDQNNDGVFHYVTEGAYPIDRVNLRFPRANSLADAVIESRSDPKSSWMRRCSGLFYRVDKDRTHLLGAPQAISTVMDRYWRVSVSASQGSIGGQTPRLELGYRPHDLYFLARGSGNFLLAFGSAVVEPTTVAMGPLVEGLTHQNGAPMERWLQTGGRRFLLGGPDKLTPPPKQIPVKRLILWTILLAGVLVVGGMAWRLARRMGEV